MALSDSQRDELERLVLNLEAAKEERQKLIDEINLITETLLNLGGLTLEEMQDVWNLSEEAAQEILDSMSQTGTDVADQDDYRA